LKYYTVVLVGLLWRQEKISRTARRLITEVWQSYTW